MRVCSKKLFKAKVAIAREGTLNLFSLEESLGKKVAKIEKNMKNWVLAISGKSWILNFLFQINR